MYECSICGGVEDILATKKRERVVSTSMVKNRIRSHPVNYQTIYLLKAEWRRRRSSWPVLPGFGPTQRLGLCMVI